MSNSEVIPIISIPRPQVRRSKSTPGSKTRSPSITDATASGMSSMLQTIKRAFSTPIIDSSSSTRRRRSATTTTNTATGSRPLRPAIKIGRDKDLPALPRASGLRSTTMSLLSTYSIVRMSIMNCEGSGRPTEEIIEASKRYYTSMRTYLIIMDDLPPSVRDTLKVQRLRRLLEFNAELLQPVMQEEYSQQTITLLDNTLLLVKTVLSEVQLLLLQQKYPLLPTHDEDRDDSSPMDCLHEYDVSDAHLKMLTNGPDEDLNRNGPHPSDLRRSRSAAAALGVPSSSDGPPRGSRYANNRSTRDSRSIGTERGSRRVWFTANLSTTQETLLEEPEDNVDSRELTESLAAIEEHSLCEEANEPSVVKPEDAIDANYAQDGTTIAMSPPQIIDQLIDEQNAPLVKSGPQALTFTDTVFTTFRFFWDPLEFLGHLMSACNDSFPSDRKVGVVLLLQTWVLAYWLPRDAHTEGLIPRMRRFLGKALTDDSLVVSSIVIDILTRLEEYAVHPERSAIDRIVPEMEFEPMPFSFVDFSRDFPLLHGYYDNIRVMEFDNGGGCTEFARQLTLKESALYLQLTAREVISYFVNKGKDDAETHLARDKLDKMRDFGCTVKRWAAWRILKRSTPLKRAKAFAFMMRLARTLLTVRNFSSAHSILNGALSIHLDILHLTESEITERAKRDMEFVSKFFDENKDISMQSSAQPTVPIIASYAGKLSRLIGSKGVMTTSGVDPSVTLVNISFFKAATRITYAMESNQYPYEFKAHAPLQGFIDHTLGQVPSEDEIHELYLSVKKKEETFDGAQEKMRLMKRLHRSSPSATLRSIVRQSGTTIWNSDGMKRTEPIPPTSANSGSFSPMQDGVNSPNTTSLCLLHIVAEEKNVDD